MKTYFFFKIFINSYVSKDIRQQVLSKIESIKSVDLKIGIYKLIFFFSWILNERYRRYDNPRIHRKKIAFPNFINNNLLFHCPKNLIAIVRKTIIMILFHKLHLRAKLWRHIRCISRDTMRRSALVETRPRDISRLYNGEQRDVYIFYSSQGNRVISAERVAYNIEPIISYRRCIDKDRRIITVL